MYLCGYGICPLRTCAGGGGVGGVCSEEFEQGVDVGFARGPAGGEAHDVGVVVVGEPGVEGGASVELRAPGAGEEEQLLVGRRVGEEAVALPEESVAELHGHVDGVARDAQVESVGEEGVELDAEQAAFGEEGAVLLDDGEEVGQQAGVGDDDCFAEERSDFRAPDVEHVAQACDVGERDVGCVCGEAVSQACAVDVEGDAVAAADSAQGFELGEGVEGAVFGRVGDVEHAGGCHVGVGGVGVEGRDVAVDVVGADFPVVLRESDDLVPAGLDGSGFVHVDVSRLCGEHSFPGPEDAVDDGGVGLCASDEEVHGCVCAAAGLPDAFARVFAIGVESVAGCLFHVGPDEPFEDERVCSFHVVAIEV